jgi:hypothetical protein
VHDGVQILTLVESADVLHRHLGGDQRPPEFRSLVTGSARGSVPGHPGILPEPLECR